jgi:hypothetical protein
MIYHIAILWKLFYEGRLRLWFQYDGVPVRNAKDVRQWLQAIIQEGGLDGEVRPCGLLGHQM